MKKAILSVVLVSMVSISFGQQMKSYELGKQSKIKFAKTTLGGVPGHIKLVKNERRVVYELYFKSSDKDLKPYLISSGQVDAFFRNAKGHYNLEKFDLKYSKEANTYNAFTIQDEIEYLILATGSTESKTPAYRLSFIIRDLKLMKKHKLYKEKRDKSDF